MTHPDPRRSNDPARRTARKPKHSHGGLVGNTQESERGAGPEGSCAKAPGHLVGNFQEGQPDCDPKRKPR